MSEGTPTIIAPGPPVPRATALTDPLRRLRRVSPDTWALVAIAIAVLAANLPYLLGFFDPNPLDFRSGLTSALTPGWLSGKPTIDPSNGFTSQAIGHLAALDLLHLHLPWWNPYEATGMPLLGETQSAALFPLTLLTALANGQLYEHVLLELIAGICTYRLLRRLDLVRPAALAGAIAFALNGKFAWFADATVNPLPFLPMLALGIERAYAAAREGRRGGWRLIAVAGALSAYAGFPEVAYVDGLLAVCWAAWRCGCLPRGQRGTFLVKAALGAGVGTLLAAPILLAMGTYLSHADLGVHTSAQLGSVHLGSAALPQLLMPYVYGEINADPHATTWIGVGGYLSSALLLCALLGVLSSRRRGLTLMLVGWGVLVFARMYGFPPLLGHVLGVLPDVSRIQFFRYATATLELPVIVLAALGLDALMRAPARRRRLLAGTVIAGAAVVAATLGARPVVHRLGTGFHHGAFFHGSVLWAALSAAALVVASLLPAPRVRAALLTAIVVVDALALFAVPEFAAPRATTLDLGAVSYLRTHLGDDRFFTLGPIAPDYGSYFGLASVGVDDFPPTLYARYVRAHMDPAVTFTGFRPKAAPSPSWELLHHLPGYRFAGVRYVLTPPGVSLPQTPTTLQMVFASSTTKIYRVAGAAPYLTAPGCAITSSSRENADVTCPRPAMLVRRETALAGWSAQIDGHAAAVRRVGGVFEGVIIPTGRHRVSFRFAPPGMNWALLALVCGCALMFVPRLRPLGWRPPRVARRPRAL